MPGRDGTGPLGLGPGRSYGHTGMGAGLRLGMRRGGNCGWGYRVGAADWAGATKERLIMQKEQFQRQMDLIDRQLANR